MDIPESILGQLGNRIQHALRAYTPRDQKAVKAAVQTFRHNPDLDVEKTITQLAVGKALVSVLDSEGTPTMVEKTKIRPPESRMGSITMVERKAAINNSPLQGKYDQTVDRRSAFERLADRAEKTAATEQPETKERRYKQPPIKKRTAKNSSRTTTNTIIRSFTRIITSRIGQQLVRGILGSLFKGK